MNLVYFGGRLVFSKKELSKFFLCIIFIILFFSLSLKYKPNNAESVRPFYSLGLIFIGILLMINYFKNLYQNNLVSNLVKQPQIIILFTIVLYLLLLTIFSGEREIKDFIYFVYWLFTLPLLLVLYTNNKFSIEELLYLLSKSILIFAIVTSVIAIFTFLGLVELEYGNYILKQNSWTITRMHGYMGEPTAFGGLIGISIIAFSYMRQYKVSSYDWIIYTFLLISLLMSGSRNAIVSIISTYIIIFILKKKINIYNIAVLSSIFFVIMIFIVFLFGIDIEQLFSSINRSEFRSQEDSRLYIWSTVFNMYSNGNIFELIFGSGAGMIRSEYSAAFNASVEILYDYGIIGFILYQVLFLSAVYIGVKRYKKTEYEYYKFGVMLLIYGFSFSLFMSFFPSSVFNFPSFAFIFGIVLTAIPTKFYKKEK